MEAHQTSNLGVLGSSPSRVASFFLLMNIEYIIDNGFKVDAIADTSDNTMSGLAPSPK